MTDKSAKNVGITIYLLSDGGIINAQILIANDKYFHFFKDNF